MKTKNKAIIILLCLALFFGILYSCETLAAVTDVSAQVAGALGVIDQNVANAISQSAQSIGRAAEEITPEQEYYIGRAVGANILVSYRIYNGNPALTAYLNKICAAIIINSTKPFLYNGYHVNILDTDEINAFATSGGHIFLTRGLIACANSEDALAGVIAHEIAHIQLQHGIQSIKNSRIMQALMVTGTSAVGAYVGMNVQELTSVFNETVGEIFTTLVNNGYSQIQEFEADSTALGLMAGAGYDPQGLISMLTVLQQNQRDTTRGFGKTHPTPAQRITNAQGSIGQYQVADTRSYRQARYNTAVR
jgi:predicted Zn-dependent protease